MSFEMSCAKCEGRLMVETLGIVVACPHCGTHLSIPDEIPGITDTPPEIEDDQDYPWAPAMAEENLPISFPDFGQGTGSAVDKAASESNVIVSEPEMHAETEVPSAVRVANPDPSAVIPAIVTDSTVSAPISGFPVLDHGKPNPKEQEATPEADDLSEEQPIEETPVTESPSQTAPKQGSEIPRLDIDQDEAEQESDALPRIGTETTVEVDGFPAINVGEVSETSEGLPAIDTGTPEQHGNFPTLQDKTPADSAPAKKPAQESAKPAAASSMEKAPPQKETVYDTVYNSRRGKIVPHAVFQAWFSYTILITFGLAWAIYRIFTAKTHTLESLPDIKPLKENVRHYAPQDATMPPGHTLKLSQTQRFGNIEVTPLKVTKGNVEVVGGDPDGPVLKLFLRFKNVSEDQTIVPLDDELLYDQKQSRSYEDTGALANQFVCKTSEKRKGGDLVFVFARYADLGLDFRNQNLGKALKPGEEVTIYIPSETGGLEYLTGELVWRVHFRKGYSAKNYGVTTVFEVRFHSDEIQTNGTAV